jgi:hypothetical protein
LSQAGTFEILDKEGKYGSWPFPGCGSRNAVAYLWCLLSETRPETIAALQKTTSKLCELLLDDVLIDAVSLHGRRSL